MASRQQKSIRKLLTTEVTALKDSLAFERAKVNASVIIIAKLRNGSEHVSASRQTAYWLGYWDAKADRANGTIPDATRAKSA